MNFKGKLKQIKTVLLTKETAERNKPETKLPRPAHDGPLNLILFIGHHKVGSTSLQDFLARNSVALAREGILYPFVETEGLAYVAAQASDHPKIKSALPINIREPHNALAFKMMAESNGREIPDYHENLPSTKQMFLAIQNQIRFSSPHTVILAAEVFANFNATDPKLIKKLVAQFPDTNVTIFATLRRIDEYIASWHGQRLKFGHKLPRLSENGVKSYAKSIHFDYRLMLEGWVSALPEANVILRNYTDVIRNGGSVNDFFQQNGIELPANVEPERRVNDSFHRATYEIARRANLELAPDTASVLRKALRKAPAKLGLPASNKIDLFGQKNRKELASAFSSIDAYLASIARKEFFFPDLKDIQEPLEFEEDKFTPEILNFLCELEPICSDPDLKGFVERLKQEFAPTASS